jgi:hypothetical protein
MELIFPQIGSLKITKELKEKIERKKIWNGDGRVE